MAVNIVFGTVFLPEESFMRHFNLPGACYLPAWNYSKNRFNFPVTVVVKLLLALAFADYFSSSPILLRNLLDFVMDTSDHTRKKKPCKAFMNQWDVLTKAGVTTLASCLTPESCLGLWRKRYCSLFASGRSGVLVKLSFVLEMAEKEFTGALLTVMYLPQASSIPLFLMEVEENDCSLH